MPSDREVINLANALVKDRCASAEGPGCCALHGAALMMAEALRGLINCHTGAKWQTVEIQCDWWIKAHAALRAAKGDDNV